MQNAYFFAGILKPGHTKDARLRTMHADRRPVMNFARIRTAG